MSDLHDQVKRSKGTVQRAKVDMVGWIFLLCAIGIVGVAGAVAYNGNSAILQNEHVLRIGAR